MKRVKLPLTKEKIKRFKAGDELLLCGRFYTARDAAHKRFCQALKKRESIPVRLKDNIIYYCGPTPARAAGEAGSCGPTTSKRMDNFTPRLLKAGLAGVIGKGRRTPGLAEVFKRYKAVYLVAVGGAGAYLSKRVKRVKAAAYQDLGPEAVYEFDVEDFPVTVAIDSKGKTIFK